jgi:serine/threonine-protein kinase
VLASLNHLNIAAIYGFEESNGVQALVLELVEGPTLVEVIGTEASRAPAAAAMSESASQRLAKDPDARRSAVSDQRAA